MAQVPLEHAPDGVARAAERDEFEVAEPDAPTRHEVDQRAPLAFGVAPVLGVAVDQDQVVISAFDLRVQLRHGRVLEADRPALAGADRDRVCFGRNPVLDRRAEDAEPDHGIAQEPGLVGRLGERGGARVARSGRHGSFSELGDGDCEPANMWRGMSRTRRMPSRVVSPRMESMGLKWFATS